MFSFNALYNYDRVYRDESVTIFQVTATLKFTQGVSYEYRF